MNDARWQELESVAGPVSRETFEWLVAYEEAFRRWNAHINLVAASTLKTAWTRHIADSAQLIRLAGEPKIWVDLGSGGGFPGAIVAIMLGKGCQVHLVESNRKKAAFLRTALATLAPTSKVHAIRIEAAHEVVGPVDVVSARALAALPLLLQLSSPWLGAGARGLFHKGRDYRREVEESRDDWHFDLVERSSAVDCDGAILEITGLRRKI